MNERPRLGELIDDVADRFESAWQAEGTPELDKYLPDWDPEQRVLVLEELIRIDAAYRSRLRELPRLDDYLVAFPELHNWPHIVDELKEELASLSCVKDDTQVEDSARTHVGFGRESASAAGDWEVDFASDVSPEVPARISRFRLIEPLGSGSFGMVYRAHDEQLDRQVAIKLSRSASLHNAQERDRFLREARSVAQLRHESIVSIYEAGEHEGRAYLVSELISGGTLQDQLTRRSLDPREAAELILRLARGMEYAHQRRIIHRDIKPANILLDDAGRPFMADFGLAKRMEVDATMTVHGQVLGTPAYMSPEQAGGYTDEIDHRTDIYSLGVVLYELLTGERPFRGELKMLLLQIQNDEPQAPRKLAQRVPRDLETICLKAMSKAPTRRYQTAGEFADDLQRYLRGEPIVARPASLWERAVRFSRKNWKIVIPSTLAVVAAVTVGVVTAANRIAAAEAESRYSREQALDRRREVLIERLQRLRLKERYAGWFQLAQETIREAAEIRRDPDLRDFAAATLEGIDASTSKVFPNLSSSSVAFDGEGRRLLIGGYAPEDPFRLGADRLSFGLRAGLYDLETEQTRPVGLTGNGPAFFTSGGEARQLVIASEVSLVLYDLDHERELQRFVIEDVNPRDAVTRVLHPEPLVGMTPDGSLVAASLRLAEDDGVVVVWDAATGAERFRWSHPATALALSPDGELLAVGNDQGMISLWSLSEGKLIHELTAQRNRINVLLFHAHPRRRLLTDEPVEQRIDPWMLAAGDYGGTVTIWNPTAGIPITFCLGGNHWITSVDFSPDGTLIAGGTHSELQLWDVATGDCQLRIHSAGGHRFQWIESVRFSPDGRRLAVASQDMFAPAVTAILTLHEGHGVTSLRGLSTNISKVYFSPDDTLIAALSHHWEIGVWRVADGRLLKIFDAPEGFASDNASLIISPDGRWLAFSTFREARLWEIETGRLIAVWPLPPGLQDQLAFDAEGTLHLLRFETMSRSALDDDGQPLDPMRTQLPPLRSAPYANHPRVCRLRKLIIEPGQQQGRTELIRETFDFDVHVRVIELAPDLSYWVGMGDYTDPQRGRTQLTRAFDVATGESLWSEEGGAIAFRRGGPLVMILGPDGRHPVFELPSGQYLFHSPPHSGYFSPHLRLATGSARRIGDDDQGLAIVRIGEEEPFLTVGIDRPTGTAHLQFSLDETRVAWTHTDGTLNLGHLPTMQQELARFGLGW